ncbi:ABC transporter substrate-binding protein [Limobrevibacterium gyesilva]|uniref:ABC transporter substrate-binding protein n=1 Tax=Limobrevibacterium gyesilva TaxID=2991712 RepID=A0AA41YH32_9PROT|nr:ABC transporter substrate-binding protein [Limobrevibacterium gyesilva]MCW3473091.1 ABC transporter substrate-binding protein [Limobrevibacterium gyesilva]
MSLVRAPLSRRGLLAGTAAAGLAPLARAAAPAWAGIERAGRGQTVFWNAWGGDDRTNAFIAWTSERMKMRHDLQLRHVRLRDTSEAVARVVAEKVAGRNEGGSVDLIWINGPNFLAMKQQGLLHGPVLDLLPNAALIDRIGKPTTMVDFTVPTDGYEVPWRMAQVVFVHDSVRVPDPPRSMAALRDWAAAHPGRVTHPTVRNFLGATFLKQALYELAPDPALLQQAATGATFGPVTAPLWDWYAALRPSLWRGGRNFPDSGPAQRALMNDGEIDIMISFNPSEASTAIANGTLPGTVRTYVLDGGTIGNCSFNAIPFNAAHKEGALLVADFLLSPEAQAHGMDPRILGSPTVLALGRLSAAERKLFDDLPRPVATLSDAELGRPLPEPHPSWMTAIAAEWEKRVTL